MQLDGHTTLRGLMALLSVTRTLRDYSSNMPNEVQLIFLTGIETWIDELHAATVALIEDPTEAQNMETAISDVRNSIATARERIQNDA